jgi:folate-binding protein YgfZ
MEMSASAESEVAVLADRGVVSVVGPDAEKLLAGLITNDMTGLADDKAVYAALLSPQGKILFDFLVVKDGDRILLETARERAAELVKRLSMYKLRAAVEIRDVSADFGVAARWGVEFKAAPDGAVLFEDPRLPKLGSRVLIDATKALVTLAALGAPASAEAYHAHRIGLGVPEGGRDFVFGDTFPHEALMDQLDGVSFSKGCFVGQEVVSRMQHRTNVRKRVVSVSAEHDLPAGPLPVLAGPVEIGRLGSTAGPRGLALLRIDRVAEARRDGRDITTGGVALGVEAPSYASFTIEGPDAVA